MMLNLHGCLIHNLFHFSVLSSLNLPAAIEVTEGSGLPQSLLEKADGVKQKGGITALEQLLQDLPELLKRNKDILDEVKP